MQTSRWISLSALLVALLPGCENGPDGQSATGSPGGAGAAGNIWGTVGIESGGAGSGGAGGAPGTGGAIAGDGGGIAGSAGALTGGAGSGGEVASGGTGGVPVNPACPGDAADAYLGTPGGIPGTIEAEDFDPAGYYDATVGNEGGAYRTDVDVDIKPQGSGFAVGWMTAGEWLEYTVNVTVEGDYSIVLRAGAVETGRTLELSQCGTALTGPVAIPQIAAWGEMATATAGPVHLSAGLQVIRVTVGTSDYIDFDSMTFEEDTGGTGGTGGTGETGGTGGTGGAGGTAGSGGSGGQSLWKFVGNITTRNSVDTNGRTFSTYWDQITPENAGKWGSVQPTATSGFNWATLDAIYDYAQRTGIIFKEHTFIWGSQQPSGTLTETQVKTWMQTFCSRYPNTALIDVVNEPPPHTTPSYANAIGGGTNGSWQWIINAFNWAHQYCPNAILILNDYNNVEWADQNQHFIDIANTVKAAGAPIHAVGAQSHGLSETVSTQTMQNLLAKLHNDTGLPVYITEYDIDLADDQDQLAKYQAHIPFFLDTEWIHGITLWGWIYGATWVPASGIIRTDGTPRPAMTWLMETLGRPAP
jgi:endo-1,4-beta-xylanase